MSCNELDVEQTLFLGCSVENFSCNLGWNGTPSTVTVNLVQDTCSGGERVHYDFKAAWPGSFKQTTTDPDPGFLIYGPNEDAAPEIGAPCYFRYGDFEFSGLLQSWKITSFNTDTPTYEVILASPTELLQGIQVILGEYAGSVESFNTFNVYGACEEFYSTQFSAGANYTQYAADGPILGTLPNGYGGADLNDAGMPWNKVKQGLTLLTSAIPSFVVGANGQTFSNRGRMSFVGPFNTSGPTYGLMPRDSTTAVNATGVALHASNICDYLLDIQDIPSPSADIRISGPVTDLLTIITYVCQELSCDFYVELLPCVVNEGGNFVLRKIIKIRVVSRREQNANLGAVDYFISQVTSGDDKKVISADYGRELRNESSYKMLIGANKRSIFQAYDYTPPQNEDPDYTWLVNTYGATNLWPRRIINNYFGTDSNGNVYVPFDNGVDPPYLRIDMRSIKPFLSRLGPFLSDYVNFTITSIMNATDFNQWVDTISWDENSDMYKFLLKVAPNFVGPKSFIGTKKGSEQGRLSRDMFLAFANIRSDVGKDLKQIFNVIRDIQNVAASSLMVRLPYVAVKTDAQSGLLVTSDVPADGGWTEHTSLLGLSVPGDIVDFFRKDDGTIPPIITQPVPPGLDLGLNNIEGFKYYIAVAPPSQPFILPNGDTADRLMYREITVEPDIKFLDAVNGRSPRVIVNYEDPFLGLVDDYGANYQANVEQALSSVVGKPKSGTDPESSAFPYSNRRIPVPSPAIAIPLESREITYGPWYPTVAAQIGPTQITVEKRPELGPWVYGSMSRLSQVAGLIANEGVGGVLEGETGAITIADVPRVPLGSELNSALTAGSYYGSLTKKHLIENRTLTIISMPNYGATLVQSVYYIPYGIFDGNYGPNINSVVVNFGIDGVTTSYTFRTYSPRFGTMSKYRADQIGKQFQIATKMEAKQRFLQASFNRQMAGIQTAVAAARFAKEPGIIKSD